MKMVSAAVLVPSSFQDDLSAVTVVQVSWKNPQFNGMALTATASTASSARNSPCGCCLTWRIEGARSINAASRFASRNAGGVSSFVYEPRCSPGLSHSWQKEVEMLASIPGSALQNIRTWQRRGDFSKQPKGFKVLLTSQALSSQALDHCF